MAKLLGIDVGTSGCKVLAIDETGKVLGQATAEYPLSVPRSLWSEQNPEHWWAGVSKCLQEVGLDDVDAIGLSGQMHGAVFLDSSDEVIRPAILWNDQRTLAECEEIDRVVGRDEVRRITSNPPLTGFQLPKILWLRNHEPEAFGRLRSVLLPKDYIRMKLTGERATEVSDASGTGAFDVPNRTWSHEMMGLLGLETTLFPRCFESSEVSSTTPGGIPVVGGGGDQAAGAVGTGAVAPGLISVSLGTSGVVFTSIDEPNADHGGGAHTFCHANGKWHAMGVMLSCGGALRWFRDSFYPGKGYDQITTDASEVLAGADGAAFLPYLTGERSPHNDPKARASFSGLTLSHDRKSMARAVMEGISFGLLECFQLLKTLGAQSESIRVTGGGAKSEFWVQMLSDVFQTPCVTLRADEGPAMGAAILAGVGVGVWPDAATGCSDCVHAERTFSPNSIDYSQPYEKYRDLYSALRQWNVG
jgi:xylulokinase